MARGALVHWLQSLEARELGEVLRRRPDALTAPSPGDLTQLATRLSARTAVAEVIATLPLPALQVVEALVLLGEPPVPLARLAEALGREPGDAELEATLRVLSQRALAWPDGEELWTVPYLLDGRVPGPPEPFEPVPPGPALVPADRAAIRTATATAATELLAHAEALLREAEQRPLARQRNGAVAAREQARLAGLLDLAEPIVDVISDAVLRAGLLGPDGAHLQPTTASADWLEAPPPERLARLVSGWWSGPALRRVVIRVLRDLPPDTAVAGADTLVPLVRWTAPLPARAAADLAATVAEHLGAAVVLGICAMPAELTFAVGPLGRALADGRPVAEIAAKLLPEPPAPDPLRVRATGSVVVSDDPELLDEVVGKLGLERYAPTVAGSREPAAETLAALRSAGYRPERDGARVTLRRAPVPVGAAPARAKPAVDPGELARRLAVPLQRNASTQELIRRRAPQLDPEQAELLATAVEHGTPVWIRYIDAGGRASERVIENAELAGSVIEAWCRLRRDDRAFALDKIVAVARPPRD
ncbi:hypothetical protein [Dactylosporangium sp. CA-092794]|uniref:WYL domain-containing protein n=1 Tax=Dactylosporangium sp. CA-092794 TaxID=3239929 RepID=UPI003D8DB974